MRLSYCRLNLEYTTKINPVERKGDATLLRDVCVKKTALVGFAL